ncbi:hypothetical protein SAMN05421678_104116 [Actinopolymorpha cephalotaxi]|uniref:Pyridoxamine 5'-phosphate oxidase N-terminal domain-containing protein n=1 Tax=Actinopolymorpha cephalotaxi TaxID=504797 RepID=A0A1I2PEW9_9ACTN|nr:PPOX class F420-dependent oxidoreductase [Actinopolymorpha cephalotaxi]NYH83632.1 hypothetical protein [Actinopolymorpha cephalotaxi]SFG14702.1 hypothetical protein SAMN05421678_104116 [Actinopolymorpha cephalotaxi]
MSAVPAERVGILTKRSFGHVATIGPHGEPQSSPVWIDWDGEFLLFSQTDQRQKFRNVRRDGRIAVSVTDPDEPHQYLEIRGRVDRVEEDGDHAFINKMAKKYLGVDEYPWNQPGDHRVIVYVRPEHTSMQ